MKDYREKELKWYIFAYLFLIIGSKSPEMFASGSADWVDNVEKLFASSLLAGVICALAFVLDCIYTAETKELLVCLGFTTLPGKTIFTRISKCQINDIRFDAKDAQEKYKEIIENLPSNEESRKR